MLLLKVKTLSVEVVKMLKMLKIVVKLKAT